MQFRPSTEAKRPSTEDKTPPEERMVIVFAYFFCCAVWKYDLSCDIQKNQNNLTFKLRDFWNLGNFLFFSVQKLVSDDFS
jgi:hypothetical protein